MVAFLPVIASFLLIAAHYLRAGNTLLVVVALAAPGLLLVRRRGALRAVQVLLVLAAVVWVLTLPGSMGRARVPPLAAVILLSCAALSVTSAVLLGSRRILRLYPR